MNQSVPTSEKSANLLVGLLLIGGGIVFFLLNFSILPIFGFIMGVLFVVIGAVFLAKHNKHVAANKQKPKA